MRDSRLHEELAERSPKAPVAKQGHTFRRHPWHPLASVTGRAIALTFAIALSALACATPPPSVAPAAPPPPACPIDGCSAAIAPPPPTNEPSGTCGSATAAHCRGVSAERCTELALSAWRRPPDDRALACVAGMFAQACSLGDRL